MLLAACGVWRDVEAGWNIRYSFFFRPPEWLWRALTYGTDPPFRRVAA